jgi:hypothetical protein
VRLPDDVLANGPDVVIEMRPEPLPISRLEVHVFHDWAPTNASVDLVAQEAGLPGFLVTIRDGIGGLVTVDWYGNPICTEYDGVGSSTPLGDPVPGTGGACITDANGDVFIENIPYGKYGWRLSAGAQQRLLGPDPHHRGHADHGCLARRGDRRPRRHKEVLVGRPHRLCFGFVGPCEWGDASDTCQDNDALTGGTSQIVGTARNLVAWPPLEQLVYGEPIDKPWIVLTDIGNTDTMVYRTRGNADGTFIINNAPAGTYQMVIFDDPLDYIIAFHTVVVGDGEVVTWATSVVPLVRLGLRLRVPGRRLRLTRQPCRCGR